MSTTVGTRCYTVGVFKDAEWAARGLEALRRHGFAAERLSLVSGASPEAAACIKGALGREAEACEVARLGAALAAGSLVAALDGARGDLARLGLAGTMRHAGFQAHDGQIFETLTARGGLLVAVESESRAADALAVLHAYGAGNAAIGAWTGRV